MADKPLKNPRFPAAAARGCRGCDPFLVGAAKEQANQRGAVEQAGTGERIDLVPAGPRRWLRRRLPEALPGPRRRRR
jgi:hypothetical protein